MEVLAGVRLLGTCTEPSAPFSPTRCAEMSLTAGFSLHSAADVLHLFRGRELNRCLCHGGHHIFLCLRALGLLMPFIALESSSSVCCHVLAHAEQCDELITFGKGC